MRAATKAISFRKGYNFSTMIILSNKIRLTNQRIKNVGRYYVLYILAPVVLDKKESHTGTILVFIEYRCSQSKMRGISEILQIVNSHISSKWLALVKVALDS